MKRKMSIIIVICMLLGSLIAWPTQTSAENYDIHVNQVGYERTYPKSAVVEWPASGTRPTAFELVNTATNQTVYTGSIQSSSWGAMSWYSNRVFAKLNFSSYQTNGTYKIKIVNGSNTYNSYPFKIDDAVLFKNTFGAVLNYFKLSRNSGAVWNADASVPVYGSSPTVHKDVRGGWYDASGDISKYLSHLQYTNFMVPQQTPLVVWVMSYIHEKYPTQLDALGLKNNLKEEAAFGADFLVRMKSNNPYFYATVFDNWTGDLKQRYITAYSGSNGQKGTDYQAAFREGGGMAIAALAATARQGISGAFTSTDYLNAAISAYAHLKTNNTTYVNDGIENMLDDYCALIAAVELYKATNQATYLTDARARANSIINRQHTEGWYYADQAKNRPYYHAVEAGMPGIALALYAQVDTNVNQTNTTNSIKNYINNLVTITGEVNNYFGLSRQVTKYNNTIKKDFFIPRVNESGYWWQGENARLGSLSSLSLIGGRYASGGGTTIPESYKTYYTDQLDWILGKNPYSYSMLRGHGSRNHPDYNIPKHGHTDLNGGISNGMHSGSDSGSGIGFILTGGDKWRSTEQWIPHAAWYMLAITSILDDVSMSPPGGGANLALNKPATASSVEAAGHEASKAFDGNVSTRWASAYATDPSWIYVDLGSTQSIQRVKLNWEAAYAKSYKIQVSSNGTSWTDVYSTTNGDGGIDEITFAPTNARYVRMHGTVRAIQWGYSLWEFEVYQQ